MFAAFLFTLFHFPFSCSFSQSQFVVFRCMHSLRECFTHTWNNHSKLIFHLRTHFPFSFFFDYYFPQFRQNQQFIFWTSERKVYFCPSFTQSWFSHAINFRFVNWQTEVNVDSTCTMSLYYNGLYWKISLYVHEFISQKKLFGIIFGSFLESKPLSLNV